MFVSHAILYEVTDKSRYVVYFRSYVCPLLLILEWKWLVQKSRIRNVDLSRNVQCYFMYPHTCRFKLMTCRKWSRWLFFFSLDQNKVQYWCVGVDICMAHVCKTREFNPQYRKMPLGKVHPVLHRSPALKGLTPKVSKVLSVCSTNLVRDILNASYWITPKIQSREV